MGFIASLFGLGKKEAEPVTNAPSTGISFDSSLVYKLKEDHRDLVKLFVAVKTAAAEARYGEIAKMLSDFKLALQTHLAVENVRFYAYVQQSYAHDQETSEFITGLRSEMNGIARVVLKFIEKYTKDPLSGANVAEFNAELVEIGSVLTKRIQLEETRLYSLYHPA